MDFKLRKLVASGALMTSAVSNPLPLPPKAITSVPGSTASSCAAISVYFGTLPEPAKGVLRVIKMLIVNLFAKREFENRIGNVSQFPAQIARDRCLRRTALCLYSKRNLMLFQRHPSDEATERAMAALFIAEWEGFEPQDGFLAPCHFVFSKLQYRATGTDKK